MRFLHALKGLIRSANACCMFTVPVSLLENSFVRNMQNFCDTVVNLRSFAGVGVEPNEAFADFSGQFVVKKLSQLNSLNFYLPETLNYVYKLKRRKLQIEIPHLGPQETRGGNNPASSSSNSRKEAKSNRNTTASVMGLLCQPGKSSNVLDF